MAAGSGEGGERRRRVGLVLIAALFAASIPWYRDADAEPARWLGLPDWVAVALVCYVGVAFVNAWTWLSAEVVDPEPASEAGEDAR